MSTVKRPILDLSAIVIWYQLASWRAPEGPPGIGKWPAFGNAWRS
jgi:hypothetical protein